jgi:hypothetical protein
MIVDAANEASLDEESKIKFMYKLTKASMKRKAEFSK